MSSKCKRSSRNRPVALRIADEKYQLAKIIRKCSLIFKRLSVKMENE
jgi:hypothetical protein